MRVPVVLQHSMVECGAACLAMVLGAYGHRVSLPALAAEMGVGRDGVSALALVRVARAHGLDTHALSVPAAQVPELPFPAIVHWRARHFVVVERVAGDVVTIVDPGVGRFRIATAEFARDYSGVVLTFTPGAGFQRGRFGDRRAWWARYVPVQRPGPRGSRGRFGTPQSSPAGVRLSRRSGPGRFPDAHVKNPMMLLSMQRRRDGPPAEAPSRP
ncbi:cysteine peptidase family C39 domain-containing protein [Nonomuraea sp. NPDC047529]|uniref:cysteine peptidase family C39 domain-containing protein n=1 Tax=Nonomuraea sp. NPDC047529 TaxID=3155623 RepID=UPI0033FD56A7